eukprot:gene10865-7726_t
MARYAFEHECGICIGTMGAYFATRASSLAEACQTKYSEALCLSSSFPATFSATLRSSPSEEDLRGYCESIDRCTANTRRALASAAEQTSGLDVRVVRGLGSRGYGSVRLSLITASAPSAALDHITIAASSAANFSQPLVKPFTYSEPFQHRWTDKHLSTVVFSMLPGDEAQDADAYRPSQGAAVRSAFSEPLTATVQVGDDTLQLRLPAQGAGVRGIIFADPCISSDFLYCLYEVDFDIHRKLSTFLNVAFAHPKRDVDFWQILGDNFYDLDGSVSPRWFSSLNAEVKAAFFTTVPGNHDIWIDADPRYFRKDDQLGHGFMQYYGQDTIAATHHNASQGADVPFDFSVVPDGVDAHALPPAANFFTYHQLGNLAFFGYSGAHSFEDNAESFSEACLWALEHEDTIDAILLLGHWHAGGNGASFAAATPHTYNAMMTLPHCQPLMHKVRYFMGHRHCNMMTQRHVGFMVGAQGMSDASSCYIVSYLEGAEETFLSSLWRLGYGAAWPFYNWLFGPSDTHSSENNYNYETERREAERDQSLHGGVRIRTFSDLLPIASWSWSLFPSPSAAASSPAKANGRLRGAAVAESAPAAATVSTAAPVTTATTAAPVATATTAAPAADVASGSLLSPFGAQVEWYTQMWRHRHLKGGAFGVPVVDSTQDGRFVVYYFSFAQEGMYDRFDEVIACVKERGVSGCYHLAEVWSDAEL